MTKAIAYDAEKIALLWFHAVVRWHHSHLHRSANGVCVHLPSL